MIGMKLSRKIISAQNAAKSTPTAHMIAKLTAPARRLVRVLTQR